MPRDLIPGDVTIKAIKPGDPRKRLSDGDGLYLLLFVKGGAHGWRFSYSIHGRRKLLSLGTYPDTGLALARRKADDARRLLSQDIDPSDQRKATKAAKVQEREEQRRADDGLPPSGSFEAVAREWFDARRHSWADTYSSKIMDRLVADVFPYIGRRPVGAITPPELLTVLRRIEARGAIETAHRARENCSQVFRYAVAAGLAERDPAQDLRDALRKPQVRHFPAITRPDRLAELLRAIDGYAGTPVVRAALRLAPMLLLRPGELRHAAWAEIDLEAGMWEVPAHRMKREKVGKQEGPPHLVPLASQAVEVLAELQPLTGRGLLVFRGERHHARPMSENTVNAALRALGFPADEVTGHGFRATARTMLAERLGIDETVIEAQLAHSVRDSLGRAYNRTEFIEQRRLMMQTWADYLERLRKGADVLQLVRRG
jgi:integrase